jgi:hypothetical protein
LGREGDTRVAKEKDATKQESTYKASASPEPRPQAEQPVIKTESIDAEFWREEKHNEKVTGNGGRDLY